MSTQDPNKFSDAVTHFVIGSCPLITIYPFFSLYNAYNRLTEVEKRDSKISFGSLVLLIPPLYGLIFAILYSMMGFFPRKIGNTYTRYIFTGAIASVIVSLILQFGFNIYRDWYDIENPTYIHVSVFVFYLILYYTIGQWIRFLILYGYNPFAKPAKTIPKTSGVKTLNIKTPLPSSPLNSSSKNTFEMLASKSNK